MIPACHSKCRICHIFVSFVIYSHSLSPYLKPCHIKHAVFKISTRIISPRDDMTSYQIVTLNEGLVTYFYIFSTYLMPCHLKDAVVTMSRRRKIVKPRDDITSYQLVTLNEGLVTNLFYL